MSSAIQSPANPATDSTTGNQAPDAADASQAITRGITEVRADCYDAIANGQAVRLNYLVAELASLVGRKPKSTDYISKDDWKCDVNAWDARRGVAKEVFTFAESRGCAVADRYAVTGLKSGGVTLSHTRKIAFRPQGLKSRILP